MHRLGCEAALGNRVGREISTKRGTLARMFSVYRSYATFVRLAGGICAAAALSKKINGPAAPVAGNEERSSATGNRRSLAMDSAVSLKPWKRSATNCLRLYPGGIAESRRTRGIPKVCRRRSSCRSETRAALALRGDSSVALTGELIYSGSTRKE